MRTGNTQLIAAAHRKKRHPGHADTHLAEAEAGKKTRGEGWAETTRPKTGTARDRQNKAKTLQGRKPPPPRSEKKTKRGGGGRTPPTSTPPHPHATAGPPKKKKRGTTGNGSRAHKRPRAPAPKPRENQRADKTQTHAHTHHPTRNGGVQAGHTHEHTRTPTQQPGVAGFEPKHTRPHRRPQPGVAGYKGREHTNTHTPKHPSQECRGAAATQAQAHTPAPRPQPGGAGDQGERAHKHTHTPTPQPGAAGRSRNPSPRTHSHTAHPSRERRGTSGAPTQPVTPQDPSQGWRGASQNQSSTAYTTKPGMEGRNHNPYPNTTKDPSQGWRGYRSRSPSTTKTKTQTPNNSRKPSVHSPGTEAVRVMQVTRPNEIRSPGVRLYPKACAALGLQAERATPKCLGTPVPRRCMHDLETGYTRKSGEPLGFRPKEGTCACTGAHHPWEISTSRWRQSALLVLPRAALLGATSQV